MSEHEPLPELLHEALNKELRPGECVVWVGRRGSSDDNWKIALGVLFGIQMTAFMLLWIVIASIIVLKGGMRAGPDDNPLWLPICFPLFGVPFLLFGIWMAVGPFRLRRHKRNTAYLITNQRAILLDGWLWSTTPKSFEPDQLTKIFRVERSDGSGDLILSESVRVDSDGDKQTDQVGFFGIPEVKRVEGLFEELVSNHFERFG